MVFIKKQITFVSSDEESGPLVEPVNNQFKCDMCQFLFTDKDVLNKHIESSHGDKRGNKRSRHETSLIFDPNICNYCEELKSKNIKMEEQLKLSQYAYNETKENLSTLNADDQCI